MTLPTVALETLSLSQLAALFNAYAAKPVKKFSSRAEALTRVGKLADGRAVEVADDGTHMFAQIDPVLEEVAAGTEVLDAPEEDEIKFVNIGKDHFKVEFTKKRGPAPDHADDSVVSFMLATGANPKRAGTASHARFALYRDGMTVREYLEACAALQGGKPEKYRADLHWDHARGYVRSYTARQMRNDAAGRDMEDDGEA